MMTALWSAGIVILMVIVNLILLYSLWTTKSEDRTP
jgi:hypothetical protein